MGDYVEVEKIWVDLSTHFEKTEGGHYIEKFEGGKCEHFSIRKFVSEVRKKDWKLCWPFPVKEYEEPPKFPPLEVPKFRWWGCDNCRHEVATEGINDENHNKDLNHCSTGCGSNSSNAVAANSDIQKASTPNNIPASSSIDLNKCIDQSSDNDIENNAEDVLSTKADHEIGLKNSNGNHQVSNVPSPQVSPGHIQEGHSNIRGSEVNEVSNMELDTSSMDKNYTGGDNVADGTTEHLPSESDDFEDYDLENSIIFFNKKPQKMRSLTEVMKESDNKPKTEQITTHKSAPNCPSNVPAASKNPSTVPDEVAVQGDMTLRKGGQRRVRKLILDEESDEAADMAEIEVQNLEGDTKTTETIPDNGSKDVPARRGSRNAMNSSRRKPETRRKQTKSKKNKKTQQVDNHLVSEPHQGQQREIEGMVDVSNNDHASKTFPSASIPCVSTEKGMDNCPSHELRTGNEYNISKGKRKMFQADEELNSLSCGKNDKEVEDLFAQKGAKNLSIMPVSTPIPSAQAAQNGEGLEEGPHLSLNCSSSAKVFNKSSHQSENRLPFPLSFKEGTSKPHLIEEGSQTNFIGDDSIRSKHLTNAIAGKQRGVYLEETNGARNKDMTIQDVETGSKKRNRYQAAKKGSRYATVDEKTLEVAEIMARSLPEARNLSGLLGNSTQKKTPQEIGGENGIITRRENMLPREGLSITSSLFGMSNLGTTQSPFSFGVSHTKLTQSSGIHFSPIDTSKLGPAQSFMFNKLIAGCLSSDATLQVQGGSNQGRTEGNAVQAPLSRNNALLKYDVTKKTASQPTSSSMDMISPQSGSLHMKRNKPRNFDLNTPIIVIDLEDDDENTDLGTFSTTSAKHSFSHKNNGIEPHQNQGGSLNMYSNAGVSGQMLKRTFSSGDCSTELEIGISKTQEAPKRQSSDCYKSHNNLPGLPIFGASSSAPRAEKNFLGPTDLSDPNLTVSGRRGGMMNVSKSFLQYLVSKELRQPHPGTETPLQHNLDVRGTRETSEPHQNGLGIICVVNRNPADFTVPEAGNPFMISGEDLNFVKRTRGAKSGLPPLRLCDEKNLKKGQHKKN